MNAPELNAQHQDVKRIEDLATSLVSHDSIERDPLCPPCEKAAGTMKVLRPGLGQAGGGWVVALGAASRRTAWTYFFNAAKHPLNLVTLIGVLLLGVSYSSAPVLLVGLGMEVAFLMVAPRCTYFRRSVDGYIAKADCAAVQKTREGLILQMGEAHQQKLGRIEALLDKTFANTQRRHGAALPGVGDRLGMARLTISYIRLAIAHRAYEESLATTNRDTLEATIRSIEAALAAQPESARPLLRRWLAVAHRRAECWSRTRDSLETTGHQLAIITELVYLLHQESLAPSSPVGISVEVERVLADFEQGEGALRELADLGIDDTDTFELNESSGADGPGRRSAGVAIARDASASCSPARG